jgi:hypothetical protein
MRKLGMLQHGSPAEESWHTQQIAPGSPLSARTNANPRLSLTHGQGPHSREARWIKDCQALFRRSQKTQIRYLSLPMTTTKSIAAKCPFHQSLAKRKLSETVVANNKFNRL